MAIKKIDLKDFTDITVEPGYIILKNLNKKKKIWTLRAEKNTSYQLYNEINKIHPLNEL